jgi:methyltransferase, FkbM family
MLNYRQEAGFLLAIAPPNYVEEIDLGEQSLDKIPLRWLGWVASFSRHGGKLYTHGDFVLAEIDGLIWFVRKHSEDIRLGPLLGHGFENHEYHKWFKPLIHPGSVFVDVGANVGGYALRAAKMKSIVYALEPNMETFWVLQQNMLKNRLSFQTYNLAAGSKNMDGVIYGREGHEGKFSLTWFRGATVKRRVKIVTLDELLMGRLERVDLLKVDVEGAEKQVLEGSQNLLKVTRYVMLELRNYELADWLGEKGFRVKDVGSSFGDSLNVLFEKI